MAKAKKQAKKYRAQFDSRKKTGKALPVQKQRSSQAKRASVYSIT